MAKKSSVNPVKGKAKNMEKEVKGPTVTRKDEDAENQYLDSPESEEDTSKTEEYVQKLTELQEKYLRLSAEFDNYRKRTLREKTELLKSASEDVLVKILPVMDDFERALGSIGNTTDIEALRAGIHLIYSKFKDFLAQQGVREMDSLNDEFDTDRHEAVTKIPVQEDAKKGKVVDVIEKGYLLNEKVVRYAKVIIGD